MATVIALRVATLHELQTVYDTEDMMLLLECALVHQYNSAG